MTHFAQVQGGVVTQVIVAEQDFIDSGAVGTPSDWVQTSYNTIGGVHYGEDGQPDSGTPLRKNYAGVGFIYDAQRDAFIPPKPFNSWVLDEQACWWIPPVAKPDDNFYTWDEVSTSWVLEE
jgi:hypothetical protein